MNPRLFKFRSVYSHHRRDRTCACLGFEEGGFFSGWVLSFATPICLFVTVPKLFVYPPECVCRKEERDESEGDPQPCLIFYIFRRSNVFPPHLWMQKVHEAGY